MSSDLRIIVRGPVCSGRTTVMLLIADALRKVGADVTVEEPDHTPAVQARKLSIAPQIVEALRDEREQKITVVAETVHLRRLGLKSGGAYGR